MRRSPSISRRRSRQVNKRCLCSRHTLMTGRRVRLFALQMKEFHLRLHGDAGRSAGEADAVCVGVGGGERGECPWPFVWFKSWIHYKNWISDWQYSGTAIYFSSGPSRYCSQNPIPKNIFPIDRNTPVKWLTRCLWPETHFIINLFIAEFFSYGLLIGHAHFLPWVWVVLATTRIYFFDRYEFGLS